jgi:hypothetical protein
MISPGTHPRSALEAERVVVNHDPGAWGLFVFPHIDLPHADIAFTDTRDVVPTELLDVLDRHGQNGTWWFAKMPPKDGSAGEPCYLTITYHGAGEYELRDTPSSARHPFILASASETDAASSAPVLLQTAAMGSARSRARQIAHPSSVAAGWWDLASG